MPRPVHWPPVGGTVAEGGIDDGGGDGRDGESGGRTSG